MAAACASIVENLEQPDSVYLMLKYKFSMHFPKKVIILSIINLRINFCKALKVIWQFFLTKCFLYSITLCGGSLMSVQINGNNGVYDGKVLDDSVRYGRNAVANNIEYMSKPIVADNHATPPILDFKPSDVAQKNNYVKMERYINENDTYLKSLPPLEFEYRYLPQMSNNKIDTKALMGAAYQELGTKALPVNKFEALYMDDTMTAEPLDINKDGKIDLAEYGTNILAADVLSKNDGEKVDGTINKKGFDAILEYSKKSNAEAATKLYTSLYNNYNLQDAYKEFIQDENNTIK